MFNPKSTNNSQSNKPLWKPKGFRQKLISTSSNSSTNSSRSLSDDFNSISSTSSSSIQTVCETMKHQIISRAFYGWLAYCRHLKTVRTHLSALVNTEITNADDPELNKGLTEEQWLKLHDEKGRITDFNHLFKLVYFGYCEPALRPKVWPYLLGHYDFDLTEEQREQQDEEMRQNYELLMTEWLAVEAIVKIRDRENLTASLAKFNSEEHRATDLDKDQLDDVFNDETKSLDESNLIKKNCEQGNNNFLIEKLLKDVIEEDENCDECKFDDGEDNTKDDENTDSRCSSTLKRQRNVYTQSSTQTAATNQILITNASVDLGRNTSETNIQTKQDTNSDTNQYLGRTNVDSRNDGQLSADDRSNCVSPASNGDVYTVSHLFFIQTFLKKQIIYFSTLLSDINF